MEFFTKNTAGEFVAATDSQIEELFRERSDRIVSKKLAAAKDKELERLRPEIESRITKETTERLEKEINERIAGEYKTKFEQLETEKKDLDIKLRRKTIAAANGFKPELEEFLGQGTDEEMQAKADILKKNSAANSTNSSFPNKEPADKAGEQYDYITFNGDTEQ